MEERKYRILFHGSNQEVNTPLLKKEGFTKDFGYGFVFDIQLINWFCVRRNH